MLLHNFFFAVEKIFEVHFRFCMSFIFEVLQSWIDVTQTGSPFQLLRGMKSQLNIRNTLESLLFYDFYG